MKLLKANIKILENFYLSQWIESFPSKPNTIVVFFYCIINVYCIYKLYCIINEIGGETNEGDFKKYDKICQHLEDNFFRWSLHDILQWYFV